MSRETKVGLLIAVSVGMLVWGFKFLKGKNLFSNSQTFYIEYVDVQGLQISTPVQVQGFQVGTVQDLYMNDDLNKVIAVLDIRGDVNVPKETTAEIMTTSMMGGLAINLNFHGKVCVDASCAQSEDYLNGKSMSMLASLIGPEQAEEYITILQKGMNELVDTLKANVNPDSELGQTFEQIKVSVDNLASTTGRVDRLLAGSSNDIQQTIANLEAISGTLKNGSTQINSILANTDQVTGQLAKADWEGTLNGAKGAVDNLNATLATTDKAIAQLDVLMNAVNNGKGSLGKLVNETELYDNLNDLSKSFNLLSHDIRIHPERYRRILSKKTKTDPITEIPEGN